ncbi:hypothetical protein [Pseudactinotalea sp. HY158]|uniref:hypothetical protein n=1 Tax=Pseudactinotalea sp. HY158 TaxID=2654547 RepID=UPI00129CCA72|nr:hypothetical protein [Pseudactinotalea sp. HY158]QGH69107.1 hypothetical protein GCE65_05995 [Pseudactinotalea sp. HY158]
MSAPADLLVYPSDDEVIPDLAEFIVSSMGTILSPTAWVRFIMDKVFDWDPLTEVLKHFSGDWNAVAQSGRAYEHLAEFADAVGAEVGSETRKVLADWEGNAADASSAYMTGTLVPALGDLAASVRKVGTDYKAVSVGMHRTAMLCNDGINTAIDFIIVAAASAAAGAATSWTGIGALLGGGGAAAAIVKALTGVKAASNAFGAAQALIDGAAGIIPGYLGAIHGFQEVDLPGGYDHAQVDR